MRTIQKDVVGALIFSQEGKMFQGLKGPNHGGDIYPGCWHIPGGGLELGEDLLQGLAREIQEEIGIDISPYKVTLLDDEGRGKGEKTLKETGERVIQEMKFHVYRIDIDKPAAEIPIVLADNEFVEYQWTDLKDLKNVQVTPPSVVLFKKLGYI